MSDLISREKAINTVINMFYKCESKDVDYKNTLIEAFKALPSVQPERKRGKWIDKGWNGDWQYQTDGRGRSWHEWQCSECNNITAGAKWDFCPNCGADMRGEEHETHNTDERK